MGQHSSQRQATSEALCDIFGASEVQETSVAPIEAVEGGSLAGTWEIGAEFAEKQIRKLPNNKGGPSMKTLGDHSERWSARRSSGREMEASVG